MSEHIPDVTKMISDTPRMKAANMAAMEHSTGDVWRVGCDLECELTEMEQLASVRLAYIKQLEEQLMDTKNKHAVLVADVVLNEDRAERIKRLEEENNELRAEEARLLNTNRELERRIKRLEEAGDAVAAIIGPPGSAHWADENQVDAAWTNWTKAKEAK